MSREQPRHPLATETDQYPFPTLLDPVRVPASHHPIELHQFWRGEHARGMPLPLHWTLVVRTAPDRGNTHEIVGETDTYATQDRFDVSLRRAVEGDRDWRGGHVVGYVSPPSDSDGGGGGGMEAFWNRIALVRVVRGRAGWNCQDWAYEALMAAARGASEAEGGVYVQEMTLERLQAHMLCLLEAWEQGDI